MFRCIFFLFFFIVNCESKPKTENNIHKVKKNGIVTEDKSKFFNLDNVAKGKAIYFSNCISCHNSEPQKKGVIGPIIFGSSVELLSLKLNFGKYPKDYIPKRNTNIMPLMSHLDNQIMNLYVFLNKKN